MRSSTTKPFWTQEEDKIIRECVAKHPDNISLAMAIATEKIFQGIAMDKEVPSKNVQDKYYMVVKNRWYQVLSKSSASTAFMLFSKNKALKNRKTSYGGKPNKVSTLEGWAKVKSCVGKFLKLSR